MQKSRKWKHGAIVRIYQRDGQVCRYCGRRLADVAELPCLDGGPLPENYPTLDHVVPRSQGGGNSIMNMVVACFTCNLAKGDKTPGKGAGRKKVTT